MIKSYISENNIQDIEFVDLKKIYKKIKSALKSETIDEKKPKNLFFSIINFLVFSSITILLISFLTGIGIRRGGLSRFFDELISASIEDQLVVVAILAVLIFTFFNLFTKDKTIRRNLKDSEIKSHTKSKINDYLGKDILSEFEPSLNSLGKILYLTKNKVTDNVSQDYLGDIHISYPSNSTNGYCLTIVNYEEEYILIKKFNVNDIILCRKYQLDYNESLYKIDNSVHEEALRAASNMELKATLEGVKGSYLNKSLAQNNAKKIRNALREKNAKLEEKRRTETEVLILKFEDGSKFEINHIDDTVLAKLQRIIENN
jgi:hypothetical protein